MIYDGNGCPTGAPCSQVLLGSLVLPRPRDDRVQAPRAVVREGPVMVDVAGRPAQAARRPSARMRRSPSTSATSASSTASASPRRRRSAARSSNLFRREPADDVLGAARRHLPARPRRVARGHRPERRRQEHAAPGARRDHHAVGGRGRRRRPDLEPADPRRRLRPGPDRPRQHPAGRRVHGHRARRDAAHHTGHRRVRRHRPVHRRADQDLLVGHARAARLRDRDLGRPRHPAARRGPRDRRRGVPGEVQGSASSSSCTAAKASSS